MTGPQASSPMRTAHGEYGVSRTSWRGRKHRVLRLRHADLVALLIPVAVLVRLVPAPIAAVSYLILGGYALLGRAQAVEALGISWFLTIINPGIASEPSLLVGRYAVMAAAALSVLLRSIHLKRGPRVSKTVLATILVGTFIAVHSLFFSQVVDVSLLKTLSWAVVTSTLLSAWGNLSTQEATRLEHRVFGGLTAVALLSVSLLPFPVGFLRNSSGFQGLLNHPQAFGVSVGLLGTWAAARMLGQPRPSWRTAVLAGLCVVLVILSEARTAGLGMAIGLGAAILSAPVISGRAVKATFPGLGSRRVHAALALALVFGLVAWPMITERVSGYVTKRDRAQSLAQAYNVSRGALIDDMLLNIRSHPLQGIGFGVASHPSEMEITREGALALPSSASVEKGVAPLAALEELGLLGFIVVSLWLWMVVRRAAQNGIEALAVIATILVMNMGESVLFSTGGAGMLMLVLLGWSARPAAETQGA